MKRIIRDLIIRGRQAEDEPAPSPEDPLPFEADALAWWDNRTEDFAVTGALVDTWTDRKNSLVLTGTTTTRPTLNTIDGKNYVTFANGPYFTIDAGFSWSRRAASLFVVCRRHDFSNGDNVALVSVGAGTTDETFLDGREIRIFNSGNQATGIFLGSNISTVYRVANGATNVLMGFANQSSAETAMDAGTISGGYVGMWGSGTNFPYVGDILAIIAYNRALTAGEIEDVQEFITDRYNATPRDYDRAIVFDGDSLTEGVESTDDRYWSYPDQLARSITTGQPRLVNIGIGGQQIQNVTAATACKAELSNWSAITNKVVVFWMGSNDINNARTGAQVWADIETYISTVKATYASAVFLGLTILERADNSVDEETQRAALNALILGTAVGDGGFDHTLDLTADARLADPTDTTYFDSDGIHLNDAGYGVVAELVKAKLVAESLI